jgi:maltodextrin utilization protein YvdJ
MKALAVKLERENNNLQKRIRLTQEELRLEQESHREITEDYKKLKKTLTDKKIARKSVRS